jgi:hypothetical protein
MRGATTTDLMPSALAPGAVLEVGRGLGVLDVDELAPEHLLVEAALLDENRALPDVALGMTWEAPMTRVRFRESAA